MLLKEGWLVAAMIEYLYLATCAECGCHKFKMLPCKTITPICVLSELYLGGLL